MVSRHPTLELGLVRVRTIACLGICWTFVGMGRACRRWAHGCRMRGRDDLAGISMIEQSMVGVWRFTLDVLDHLAIAGRRRVTLQLSC